MSFKLEDPNAMPPRRTVAKTDPEKAQEQAERNAIKADYKKWAGSLSYQDFVKHAKTCYNTYMETAGVKTLQPHERLAFFDAAQPWKDMIDYIERQAK